MGALQFSYPACPLVLHKQPHHPACPQMTSSPPVASAAPLYSAGAEPQRGSLGLAARAGSRLSAGGAPLGSAEACRATPRALLWLSECRARTASVGPILPTVLIAAAMPPWPDCKGCAAVSLPGMPPRKVCLAAKKGYSGLRLALQDPAVASLVPELAPAGPARGQVVGMRWLRAWDTSRLHRAAGRAERGLC